MNRPPFPRPEEWPGPLELRRPDPDRLLELSQRIAANDYYVAPERVAEAIIDFFARPDPED